MKNLIGKKLNNDAILINGVTVGNREIILAMMPGAYEPYITWCKEEFYMWGHYFRTITDAVKDYNRRIKRGY